MVYLPPQQHSDLSPFTRKFFDNEKMTRGDDELKREEAVRRSLEELYSENHAMMLGDMLLADDGGDKK